MPVSPYLSEVVSRLLEAELRMDAAQAKPAESSNLRESLRALNDYARALAEINLYTTEALQARLEAVEARIDLSNRLLIGSTALA